MGPTRTNNPRATRTRANPLNHPMRDKDARRDGPSNSQKFETVDGSVLGWQYKVHYIGSAPEVGQLSFYILHYKLTHDPQTPCNPDGARIPENPRPPPLKLRDLQCIQTLGTFCLASVDTTIEIFDRPGRVWSSAAGTQSPEITPT